MSDSTAAQKNREAFPQTAQLLDQLKQRFGQSVRVQYASENGRSVGSDVDMDLYARPVTEADLFAGRSERLTTAKQRRAYNESLPNHMRLKKP